MSDRLPFYLVDSSGVPVIGQTFSGSEIQLSKNGAALFTGTGLHSEIGLGAYYYELATGEDDTPGQLVLRVLKSGAIAFSSSTPIPIPTELHQGQLDSAQRRIMAFLVNTSGAPVTGASPTGAQLQVSQNGSGWFNAGGSWTEIGGGAYYYTAAPSEVATIGPLLLRVAATGALVWVMSTRIGSAVADSSTISITPSPVHKFQPILANLLISGDLMITYESGTNRFLIYDRTEQFHGFFGERSSVTQVDAQHFMVSILPNGGWWTSEFRVRFFAGVQAIGEDQTQYFVVPG